MQGPKNRPSGYQRRKAQGPQAQAAEFARRRAKRRTLSAKALKDLRSKEAAYKRDWRRKLTPAKRRDQNRKHDQSPARKAKARLKAWARDRLFLAVDGEAVDGKYVLLAASDGTSIQNLRGLKTSKCLAFLTSRGVPNLWTFALDYDVNMMLADLPEAALYRLTLRKNRTFYSDYQIEHLPGKMLLVWNRFTGDRVRVWDIYSFVGTSFADWLEDWRLAPPEEIAAIREMKTKRPDFKAEEIGEIKRYCFQELKYLQTGVSELLDRVEKTGYHPAAWHSPGSVSAAVMREKGIVNHRGATTGKRVKIAAAAYYGGRFETRVIGLLGPPLYSYDINSAYPSALETLPCMACGKWRWSASPDLDDPYALVRATWKPRGNYGKPGDRQPWGPLPIRVRNGGLRYPVSNPDEIGGWYWSFEARQAKALTNLRIHEGYSFIPGCDHQPFAWVPELYAMRQELKRQGDSAEYVLKLILNSAYGKLAQRPRPGAERPPPFYSPVWAGMVTARTRAQILGAIIQDPEAILEIATDGLTSIRPLDLPITDRLGDWSLEMWAMLFILQSGIYWWRDVRGKTIQKSRGFHPASMTYRRCLAHWKRYLPTGYRDGADHVPPLTFHSSRFIGYRVALQRDRPDLWRTWDDSPVSLMLDPWPRREFVRRENGYILSAPLIKAERPLDIEEIIRENFRWFEDWLETDQPDGPD